MCRNHWPHVKMTLRVALAPLLSRACRVHYRALGQGHYTAALTVGSDCLTEEVMLLDPKAQWGDLGKRAARLLNPDMAGLACCEFMEQPSTLVRYAKGPLALTVLFFGKHGCPWAWTARPPQRRLCGHLFGHCLSKASHFRVEGCCCCYAPGMHVASSCCACT